MVTLGSAEDVDSSFGELGLKVGSRSGPDKRSNGDKEWYILRRFLKEALPVGVLGCPIEIRQGVPPHEPDFVIKHQDAVILLEMTEATCEADQREMALIEKSDKPAILLGELGGRYQGGASNTGPDWAQDIIDAVFRKRSKAIFLPSQDDRHLVIYPNSNASFLLCDEEDEREATLCLASLINDQRADLASIVSGSKVHVLAKSIAIFDVLGEFSVFKRVSFTT